MLYIFTRGLRILTINGIAGVARASARKHMATTITRARLGVTNSCAFMGQQIAMYLENMIRKYKINALN